MPRRQPAPAPAKKPPRPRRPRTTPEPPAPCAAPVAPGTRAAKGGRGGQPGRLTPETQADIVRMLEAGAYLTHAAGAIGVDRRTLYRWLAQGQRDTEAGEATQEASFWAAVGKARDRGRVGMCEVIERAGKRDWRAAAWMLERTDPELFGERVELGRRPEARGDAPPPDLDPRRAREQGDADRLQLEADALDLLTDAELELIEKLREREVTLLMRARGRRGSVA